MVISIVKSIKVMFFLAVVNFFILPAPFKNGQNIILIPLKPARPCQRMDSAFMTNVDLGSWYITARYLDENTLKVWLTDHFVLSFILFLTFTTE